ncbi:MAG: 1-acyl-sn-glycerol-3-phosphate acyltransferase [Blastocatellia bacterium]|nr:1-acyl-sn-glycerol-3-phosphate acyltransferase [Blastocatellia bacterium]
MIEQTATETLCEPESSTGRRSHFLGRLFFWWSMVVAAVLLLIFAPPVLLVAGLANRREWVYPWALFGARNWLRLSGMRIKVRGLELLDSRQTYVFISNHRSYLDTATLFQYVGRRIGLIAKKELLKVPLLGYGMGYVNVMAIDRTNRERAVQTMQAATKRIQSGVSFGVFAEGTRAFPGQMLPFKKGAFYMARDAGVPIVPVAIKNTDVLMGKGTGEAWPGTIEVVMMPPVRTNGITTDKEVNELIATVQSTIADELGVKELTPRKPSSAPAK